MNSTFRLNVPAASGMGIVLQAKGEVFVNLNAAECVEHALKNGEGVLADNGALACDTGKFTGRSPEDKYFVVDDITRDTIWWGDVNHGTAPEVYDRLASKLVANLADKRIYVRDCVAGVSDHYSINLKIINTKAYQDLFCYNMFVRPSAEQLKDFKHDFLVICDPDFEAEPAKDGVRKKNFAIINLTQRVIIIGGTAYTGEIKKGVYSVLNFLLPYTKGILSMHCSANMDSKGDTAVFFGLSGTGKTTLSADPNRNLIGDDEHGWDEKGIFNFEGGCYAKTINISAESEPEIWNAIKFGSVLENVRFFEGTRKVNYADNSVTDNTRVSYPLHYIPNSVEPSVGNMPNNIFFLTCDAYGVLPPISKLSPEQAMFHFMSGYTAKVAGTEVGIKEPKMVFSTCFGAPFMPLHPSRYAELLGKKMKEHNVNVWLVNTGWTGGGYGVGNRMKLRFTREMISAALNGELNKVDFVTENAFGFMIPSSCPNVPAEILNPRNTWADKTSYDEKAQFLANAFVKNFKKFESESTAEILAGAPAHAVAV